MPENCRVRVVAAEDLLTMSQARKLEEDLDALVYEHAVALTAGVAVQDLDRSGLVIVQVAEALARTGRHPPRSAVSRTPTPVPLNSGASVAPGKDESCPVPGSNPRESSSLGPSQGETLGESSSLDQMADEALENAFRPRPGRPKKSEPGASTGGHRQS